MGNNTSPAPVHQLVRRALEVCQGYEYYYDAYYGPDAPFADGRPKPADVAMALQNICRLVPEVIRGLRREREELLAIADRNREELAARVRYLEGEIAMPVGPNRFIDINGDILTIAEFMAAVSECLAPNSANQPPNAAPTMVEPR